MNLSDIYQLSLSKKDFKEISYAENYSIKFLTPDNFSIYNKELQQVISYIPVDLPSWEDKPTMDDIRMRFDNKSHCLLWIYNNQPIGWAWSNSNVTLDWKNCIKTLPNGTIYGGGAFLSRSVDRPPNAGLIFYNLTFKFWLFELNNNTINQYSDKWNRVSSILSYKCGFKNDSFIQDKFFNERTLTTPQLDKLISMVDNANTPSTKESQHYYDNVYGVGKPLPKIARNGTFLTALSVNNNSELVEWLVNFTGIEKTSIHSLHTVDYPEGSDLKSHKDTRSSNTFVFILQDAVEGGGVIFNKKVYKFDKGKVINYNGQKLMHGVTEVKKGYRKTLVLFHGHKSLKKSTI